MINEDYFGFIISLLIPAGITYLKTRTTIDNSRDKKLVLYYSVIASIFPLHLIMCWTSGIPKYLFEYIHEVIVISSITKFLAKSCVFDPLHLFGKKAANLSWLSTKLYQMDAFMIPISIVVYYFFIFFVKARRGDATDISGQVLPSSDIVDDDSEEISPQGGKVSTFVNRKHLTPHLGETIEELNKSLVIQKDSLKPNFGESERKLTVPIRSRIHQSDSPSGPVQRITSLKKTFSLPYSRDDDQELEDYNKREFVVNADQQASMFLQDLQNAFQEDKDLKPMVRDMISKMPKQPYIVQSGTNVTHIDYQSELLKNHEIVPITSDGNCFYRAISRILTGSEAHHAQFRLYCLFEYFENFKYYNDIMTKQDMDPKRIVSIILKMNAWTETIVTLMMANYLERIIYLLDGPVENLEYYQYAFRPRRESNEPIVIQWSSANHDHFVAVLPLHGKVQHFKIVDYLEAIDVGLRL